MRGVIIGFVTLLQDNYPELVVKNVRWWWWPSPITDHPQLIFPMNLLPLQ
jgi:hypothetical protein